MTVVPVMVDVPPSNYYPQQPLWFTGNDIIRLLEPIGGTIFAICLFMHSRVLAKWPLRTCDIITVLVFSLGIGMFGQGGGYHSASNMFKHSLETIMEQHDDANVRDMYYCKFFSLNFTQTFIL